MAETYVAEAYMDPTGSYQTLELELYDHNKTRVDEPVQAKPAKTTGSSSCATVHHMAQKRTASSPERSPNPGKRIRVPSARALAATEKPAPKAKKSSVSTQNTTVITEKQTALPKPTQNVLKPSQSQPSRRTSVCDVDEDKDEDSNSSEDEIVEVDSRGRKKISTSPLIETPEEELGKSLPHYRAQYLHIHCQSASATSGPRRCQGHQEVAQSV